MPESFEILDSFLSLGITPQVWTVEPAGGYNGTLIDAPTEPLLPPPAPTVQVEAAHCGSCYGACVATPENRSSHSGAYYCTRCAENSLVLCEGCQTRVERRVYHSINGDEESCLCRGCLARSGHRECSDCGDRFDSYHIYRYSHMGRWLCRECSENEDNYQTCETCDILNVRSELEDGVCEGCRDRGQTICSYSARVNTSPLGKGPVWAGIELEVECSKADPTEEAGKVYDLMGDFILIKEDGSLNHGFEIVTRPASLEVHKQKWSSFFDKRPSCLVSWNTSTCGMHVHLTRYDNDHKRVMSEMTVAKVVMFVNAPRNLPLVTAIAGRNSARWSRIYDKETLPKALRVNDRYEAVNLTNTQTIEFRIFRGTLNQAGFFKNLEFAFALKDFCSMSERSILDCQSSSKFAGFVKSRQKEFPHLNTFLKEHASLIQQ